MSQCRVPWLIRLLYTHNPFYLISACLFVYGLKLLFRTGNAAVLFQRGTVEYMSPTGLMGSLVAVTLLMAATAVLIVRLGKVWEDARSLVLIVLLMLLAISVSLDELLSMASEQEKGLLEIGGMVLSGAAIAVGMVELLIRGLQVRLSWLWRGPLYLLLTLFFGWPLLLLPEIMPFDTAQVRSLIAAFPTVAALISLLLLPGIRQGSASVRDNGTPWTLAVAAMDAVCFPRRRHMFQVVLTDHFFRCTRRERFFLGYDLWIVSACSAGPGGFRSAD
jgi:hypothetical protein